MCQCKRTRRHVSVGRVLSQKLLQCIPSANGGLLAAGAYVVALGFTAVFHSCDRGAFT